VEGENTRLRPYLARLHRKTLCYSKKPFIKLSKLITKNVNEITIKIYTLLIAYLLLQLVETPKYLGFKLLDKLRYLQAFLCEQISYVHWFKKILVAP